MEKKENFQLVSSDRQLVALRNADGTSELARALIRNEFALALIHPEWSNITVHGTSAIIN